MTNKPCPFCGSTEVYTSFENGRDNDKWGYAACNGCGAQTGAIRTQYESSDDAQWRKDAVKGWNARFDSTKDKP